jgi:putative hydrolase of the HAD superfamily
MQTLKGYEAIVLDFGDTLVRLNPSKEQLCLEVLESLGYYHSITQIKNAYSHVEFCKQKLSQVKSKKTRKEFYSFYNYQLAIFLGIEDDYKDFNTFMQQKIQEKKHWVIFPEVIEVLQQLKMESFNLYILANWDRSLINICQLNKIEDFFIGVHSSEELGAEKPDSSIFLAFIKKTEIDPKKTIYVGNEYLGDVVGSRKCHFLPILIDREGKFENNCDCIQITSLLDLLGILQKI